MAKRPSTGIAICMLALCALGSTSCGLAESIAEGFVDDRDVTIPSADGLYGTAIRRPDGTDVMVEMNVLRPGDRASDDQALAVFAFSIDPSQEPDQAELEYVRLRVWIDPGAGDVTPLGPLVLSHLAGASQAELAAGQVPNPPGVDLLTIEDVAAPGWREVDVSGAFHSDWNAGRNISAYVLRFANPSDGDGGDDDLDLDPTTGGADKRIHVVLHFGVDL